MLQWMGGSRRKVTTSRKSTQKRQKQYFEQRKRQQEQQTARQESYSDTTNACTQPQINSQSLDILSLLDLSTISQEHRSNCSRAMESLEGNVLTLSYQTTPCPQTMQSTKVTPAHAEFKHAKASSDYQLKTVYPERVLMTSPGSHNKDLNASDKVDQLKMINDQQLSVLDLLGDDGPNSNLEGSLGNESHVAFSVEGLGKVGAETPVHSPKQPCRYFPYGCSSPSKVTRQTLSFKNFNIRLDDLAPEVMQDGFREYNNDIPFYESELPFYSRGLVDYFSYPKQKKSVGKGFLQFNDNGPNLKTFLANEDIFFNREDENKYMWTESSSLPDDDFLDKSKCHISWKNWPCQMDSNSAEYFNFGNHVKKDITFEGLNVQNNRVCKKATSRFNALDSSAPYSYHQISENHHDFTTPDGTWYPMFGRISGVKPVTSQPAWSCFVAKDAKESLSLLSEESCSSSAVWDEAIEDPPSNSVGKKMRTYGSDCRSPTSKGGVKNIYTQETHCTKQDNLQPREKVNGSEKCARMSSPTPTTTFQKIIGPDKSWLFEDGDTTRNKNSSFGSFFRTSTAKESQPSCFQLSNEDLFNVYTVPKLHVDAKLSSERSKSDVPAVHSPCCSNFSEKLALCEHFNHMHSSETPFLLEIRSRSGEPKLSPVFDIRCNPHDPFKDLGCQGDTEFPGITVKESGCIDGEKEAGIPQASSGKIELQEDVCDGSNCLSSENRMTGDASNAGDSCTHHFMEAKDRTPEMMQSLKATFSQELVEEISSVDGLEAPDKTEGGLHGKKYQKNIQTHLCRNGCKGRYCPVISFSGLETYKLKLPAGSLIHDVFHVSLLKKAIGTNVVASSLPPIAKDGRPKVVPKGVLNKRMVKYHNKPKIEFLIQWAGSSEEDATCEDAKQMVLRNLQISPAIIKIQGSEKKCKLVEPTVR